MSLEEKKMSRKASQGHERQRNWKYTKWNTVTSDTNSKLLFFFLKLHLKSIYEKDYMIHLFLISLETSEEL